MYSFHLVLWISSAKSPEVESLGHTAAPVLILRKLHTVIKSSYGSLGSVVQQ